MFKLAKDAKNTLIGKFPNLKFWRFGERYRFRKFANLKTLIYFNSSSQCICHKASKQVLM